MLTSQVKLFKLDSSEDALTKVYAIFRLARSVASPISLITKDFSEISERVDGLRTKAHFVKVLLTALTNELANLETKKEIMGDTHATIKHYIE